MSSLFKYFPAMYIKDEAGNKRNYALESIQNNTLWASIPDEFNDPFECKFYYEVDDILNYMLSQNPHMKYQIEQIRRDLSQRDKIESNYQEMQCVLREAKQQFGITSFSRTDLELLMWGHYADSHRGICVEYDENEINKSRLVLNGVLGVSYEEKPFRIKEFSKVALIEAGRKMLCHKSKKWAYEEEVRAIVTGVKLGDKGITWSAPTPKSIRLGLKASERLEQDIIRIAREKNIELYRMREVSGKYAIEKQKIEL